MPSIFFEVRNRKFRKKISTWQFFVTFLGWLSDLLERLSDLQLGDEKVTLNHLAPSFFFGSEIPTETPKQTCHVYDCDCILAMVGVDPGPHTWTEVDGSRVSGSVGFMTPQGIAHL